MKEKHDSKCTLACMCPWKMCICHMKSKVMAVLVLAVLNFAYLWGIHAVVMHFAAGHAHMHMIFLAVAAVGAALIMGMHKMCCGCHLKKDE